MLYKCRCGIIVNEKEKESLKGQGQKPNVNNCFGCDSPFLPTYYLMDYVEYWIEKIKRGE